MLSPDSLKWASREIVSPFVNSEGARLSSQNQKPIVFKKECAVGNLMLKAKTSLTLIVSKDDWNRLVI
jgi:hypothetical protein